MANIEKAKLEKEEIDFANASEAAPEKPKVTRKPRKTKKAALIEEDEHEQKPVDVKIDIDLGTSISDAPAPAEVKQEEPEPVPPVPLPVSEPRIAFDEDAIATKVVSMLLEKGIGVPAKPETVKPKKPRVSKKMKIQPPAPTPPTATFTWM